MSTNLRCLRTLFVFGLLLPCLMVSSPLKAVSGSGFSWATDVTIEHQDASDSTIQEDCFNKTINAIEASGLLRGRTIEHNACVFAAKDYSLARYAGDGRNGYLFAVKLNSEDTYRVLSSINILSNLKVSPNSNRLIFLQNNSTQLSMVVDLTAALIPDYYDDLRGTLSYLINPEQVKSYFQLSEGEWGANNYLSVQSIAYSSNGRYALAWVNFLGHVKIDFDTKKTYSVTHIGGSPPVNVYSPKAIAITNNGRFGFINIGPRVIDMNNCTSLLPDVLSNPTEINSGSECEPVLYDLSSLIGFESYVDGSMWVGDEDGLRLLAKPFPYTQGSLDHAPQEVTLWRSVPSRSKLDYLALGDSFTSGRGDLGTINGSSYFINGTDGPNGCHVSSRSFPFLLQQFHNMAVGRVQSVACAGAQLSKDYYGSSSEYLGQSDQLLGRDDDTVALARSDAIKKFTPGIVKQIEFVKDTQPRIVTITAGGNDVGFGDIIAYCATPQFKLPAQNTCDIARPGSRQRAMLGDAIRSQYDSMVSLIKAIKDTSPTTVIYVVGYPSFVSDENDNCVNAAALNRSERILVNEGVRYMNQVLRTAAESAGANYRNIESALYGGRICEGSEYVTGLLNTTGIDFENQKAHMFHPNHLGHERMALGINGQGFSTDESNPNVSSEIVAPNKPKYFESKTSGSSHRRNIVRGEKVIAGRPLEFTIQSGTFKASTPVDISILPADSSVEVTSKDDGGLSARTSKLPTGDPGYRLVIAGGKDSQGKLIKLYQFIEVQSSRQDDKDGDGIRDDKDKCAYIDAWYDERSGKNVCKV